MEKQSCAGIILHARFPAKRLLVILDKNLGKIEVVPSKSLSCHFATGFLIQYQLEQWRQIWIACHVETLATPCVLDQQDMLFVHQLFEICLVYSPLHQVTHGLFELVALIYSNNIMRLESWKKKILLCKLLILLGICPEFSDRATYTIITSLSHMSVEDLVALHYPTECITLELENNLTFWLETALVVTQEHMRLKTFSFGSVTNG